MTTKPQRHYSVDEYYSVEESSPLKHEFHRGEIFAMAGASIQHLHIAANVLAALRVGLRGKGCDAFGSDLRVSTPSGLYTYPDVTVVCGKIELLPDRPATVVNPTILVEVLSDATRDYDRGEKFELYRSIPALREYVLIEQSEILIETFDAARGWSGQRFTDPGGAVDFVSVAVTVPLREIYAGVF